MSDKKDNKLTYALSVESAKQQMQKAKTYFSKAKTLIETYCCSDVELNYKDSVIDTLAEYITNMKFYSEFLQNQLLSGNRIKNEKTGEDNIIVLTADYNIINSYLITTVACENELEAYGVSMQTH